jgi:hypothetical protein
MNTNAQDQEVIKEVFDILIENLELSKVMRFLSLCKLEEADYLEFKDKLCDNETVDSIYEKIQAS